MERVRINLVQLMKYVKNVKNRDSFKIYKNPDVNKFFWLVCIIGGILRSKKVGKTLKILWLIYHITSVCLLIGYNTYAFVHTKEESLKNMLMLLLPVSSAWLMIASHVLTFFFYKSLEKYTDELDKHLSTSLQQEHDQCVTKSQFFDTFVLSLLFVIFCILGIRLFFPFAFIEFEANSKVLYSILSTAKFTSTLPYVIIAYCGLGMRAIYVKKFCHTFNELINQIKCFSIATLQNLELTHHREMIIESDTSIPEEREYHLNLLSRRRQAIYENVDENIAYFAKQHQKLFRIHTHIKTYFETVCSFTFVCSCSIQVMVGIHILQVIESRAQVDIWSTTLLIVFACIITYLFNEYCAVITAVEDEIQKLCNEIYSIPWYLLPKKNRKMIRLLLTQCQHIPQFRLFGMYPFGVALVPQILNLEYSYISALRVIMLKKSQ